jgi:hypothetical protein
LTFLYHPYIIFAKILSSELTDPGGIREPIRVREKSLTPPFAKEEMTFPQE